MRLVLLRFYFRFRVGQVSNLANLLHLNLQAVADADDHGNLLLPVIALTHGAKAIVPFARATGNW